MNRKNLASKKGFQVSFCPNYDILVDRRLKELRKEDEMDKVSSLDIIRQRFHNQGLIQSYTSIEELLTAALGIQSQYINHGLFNLAIRLQLEKGQKVYQTLESVILAWGQRQTYHFYSKAIWQKLTSFLAKDQTWVKNYFQAEGLDLDAALEELRGKLAQPQLRS